VGYVHTAFKIGYKTADTGRYVHNYAYVCARACVYSNVRVRRKTKVSCL